MRVPPQAPSRTSLFARQGGCGEAQTGALTTSRFLNSLFRGIRVTARPWGLASPASRRLTPGEKPLIYPSAEGLKTGSGAGFEPAYNVTLPAGFSDVGPAAYYTPSYWKLSNELG